MYTCFSCKEKDHRKFECPKLKKEEKQVSMRTTSSAVVATVQEEIQEASSMIAFVQSRDSELRKLNKGMAIIVDTLNNKKTCLSAIVDTGSPVSFVSAKVYNKFFDRSLESLTSSNHVFSALNGTPIVIHGIVRLRLTLKQLPNLNLKIDLHIMKTDLLSKDF